MKVIKLTPLPEKTTLKKPSFVRVKKFNYLKHLPKKSTVTNRKYPFEQPKQPYASAVKSKVSSRKLIRVNINNY